MLENLKLSQAKQVTGGWSKIRGFGCHTNQLVLNMQMLRKDGRVIYCSQIVFIQGCSESTLAICINLVSNLKVNLKPVCFIQLALLNGPFGFKLKVKRLLLEPALFLCMELYANENTVSTKERLVCCVTRSTFIQNKDALEVEHRGL